MNERLVNAIGWVVLAVWVVSFIMDAVRVDYEPPQNLHLMMIAIVGAAFATPALKRFGGKDNE